MSITQKLEKSYKNQIENIKNEKNYNFKVKQIGSLVMDVGKRSISAISKLCGFSWRFIKRCYIIVHDNLEIVSSKNKCGNKKVEERYPEIVNQIKEICENTENVDKSLKDDITYIDVTANYVLQELKNRYGYSDDELPCENTIRRIFKER